jgi:hypothetical protein
MLSTRLGLRSWIRHAAHPHYNGLPLNRAVQARRAETTLSSGITSAKEALESKNDKAAEDSKVEGWFFLDSVFPIRLGTWEYVLRFLILSQRVYTNASFRHYIAFFQEESLVEQLQDIFQEVNIHGFELNSVDPRLAPRLAIRTYLTSISGSKTVVSLSTFDTSPHHYLAPSPPTLPNLPQMRLIPLWLK